MTGTTLRERAFALFMLAFFSAWTLRVVLLMPVDASIANDWLRQCWSQGLRLLLWVLPVLAYLKWIERVDCAAYLGLCRRPRRAGTGAVVIIAYLAVCGASAILLQGGSLRPFLKLTGGDWAWLFSTMFIVAFAEELLFRGFVFRQLRRTHSMGMAALLSSILFLLIHIPGWLYMQGVHGGLVGLAAGVFAIALVLSVLLELTGSLWMCILLHLLNNVLSVSLH